MPNQRVSPESAEAGMVTPRADLADTQTAETQTAQTQTAQTAETQTAETQTADFETDGVEAEVVADGLPRRLMQGTWQRLTDAAATTWAPLKKLSSRIAVLARQHPREAVAVILLVTGVGYPPVWLVGALAALTVKEWERRDLWTGLAVPIGIVILGSVLIPAITPHDSAAVYAHSVWLMAGRLCRIVAVFSAGYLAWRLHRGRRTPKVLPWNIPHRFG